MSLVKRAVTRMPWIPPEIIILSLPNNTLNNLSGDGDGDAALAHS
ncbi:MAG: hypothetical protein K0S08_77 [Gammaproteobacteria bacterium]|jgi:hypothetical protein|nr:hypothetical protein [Gammaproteobacteria bacterium]